MEISGKTALVTGGAGGLGLAIATALKAGGAAPVLADIDAEELDRASASLGGVPTLVLDVTDRGQWAAARERLGIVDILVNNAGIGPDGRHLADMDPVAFDRVIGLNLVSLFSGISTFAAGMRARGSGHILNTASMAGMMSNATIGAYTAAKFGVVGMSEVLRAELAPHGVGVSVFCPGLVATRLRETTLRAGSAVPEGSIALARAPMDAAIAGRMAVDGIQRNLPHIVTHGEYRGAVEKRVAGLLAAFDGVPPSTDH